MGLELRDCRTPRNTDWRKLLVVESGGGGGGGSPRSNPNGGFSVSTVALHVSLRECDAFGVTVWHCMFRFGSVIVF